MSQSDVVRENKAVEGGWEEEGGVEVLGIIELMINRGSNLVEAAFILLFSLLP